MSLAKCHNYAGCLLAYRGEEIPVGPEEAMVCPECGKPLTIVKPPPSKLWVLLPWLVLIGLLGAGGWVGRPYITQLIAKFQSSNANAPADNSGDSSGESDGGPSKSGADSDLTATPTPEEPPPSVIQPARIDTDLGNAENKKVRDEVLKRIDLMPTVSEANKDKLYNSVERARTMGLVLTIPFASGKIVVNPTQIQQLKTALDSPDMKKLRDDPTSVFVILGYADPKGDEKKNLDISQKRADSVLDTMRDKCGVANVMHSVAMGGQKLIDAKNLEKNRVVEVWVAQP